MTHQIAIDGPAGAGKSTIAKLVAKKLGWIYVDTGAMYRAMALYLIRNDISWENEEAIKACLPEMKITLSYDEGGQQVILNGENVNNYIRTEQVSNMTSKISGYGCVREKLLMLQRQLAKSYNVVMDGRDIGTCVLPDATVKIYLTASVGERARRRYLEYCEKGIKCDINEIEKEISDRDFRDMNREIAPLKKASDAVEIDSSDMTVDEVVEAMINLYKKAL